MKTLGGKYQITEIRRVCKVCGVAATDINELESFVKSSFHRFGRRNLCKKCYNEQRNGYVRERRRNIKMRKGKTVKTRLDSALAFAAHVTSRPIHKPMERLGVKHVRVYSPEERRWRERYLEATGYSEESK